MKNTGKFSIQELTEVFANYQHRLVMFACSYVRNKAEAEDIVMNAFANVWEHREELPAETNVLVLLLTAVKNLSLNLLQHQEVRMRAERDINDLQYREMNLRIQVLEACDPCKLFAEELQVLIHEIIDELPPTSREVFVMSRMEGLPNKEIALRLDIAVKTVEFHITRSLKQLRIKLKEYGF